MGVAGATLAPSTLWLSFNMFQNERQRATAIGLWITSFSAGGAVGPVLGGLLRRAGGERPLPRFRESEGQAEADGNRTRQDGCAALNGFEDRGAHQEPRRLHARW
jgi:hypothetical protein